MRPAHHASPRARRQRRAPSKFEAVPASSTLSGDFAVAPAPTLSKKTSSTDPVTLSTDPALWVKGAVVAVHCPEDEPFPFWLCRIDEDADGAEETAITWLEPTGKAGKTYAIGGADPVATQSIICTVREAGRWKSGRGFTLTPMERAAVLVAIAAEAKGPTPATSKHIKMSSRLGISTSRLGRLIWETSQTRT